MQSGLRFLPIRANQTTIFSMLQRRPCTAEQIADIFGMHLNEVSKYLGNLMRTDQIRAERKKNTVYYAATGRKDKGYANI
jgi:predicted ArsR family transcriptional regulator